MLLQCGKVWIAFPISVLEGAFIYAPFLFNACPLVYLAVRLLLTPLTRSQHLQTALLTVGKLTPNRSNGRDKVADVIDKSVSENEKPSVVSSR